MAALAAMCLTACRSAEEKAVLEDIGRAGGIYYAYNYADAPETPAPEGYEPFYLSHYGRHGSRYLTEDARYKRVLDLYSAEAQKGNLTGKGQDFLRRLEALWEEVEGHGGQLSELGRQQHRDIAIRLQDRYPGLFEPGDTLEAYSSTSGRCQASMEAFLSTFPEELRISRKSDDVTMKTLVPKNAAVDSIASDNAPWREEVYEPYKHKHLRPRRALSALLKDPSVVADPIKAMSDLYYIVVGMQDIPSSLDFSDILTERELLDCWKCVSTRMYYVNTRCPEGSLIGATSVIPLLEDIVSKADGAVDGGSPCKASLRFGHDTILIRLLSLMGVECCVYEENDVEKYWKAWQDWNVSPMGANLQMVFYRNGEDIMVKLMLNEREVSIPALGEGPYYDWKTLREHLTACPSPLRSV